MGDRRKWNRRSFKLNGIDPKDRQKRYSIVRFKFKNKSFARPIFLEGKQATDWFLNQWELNGWSEIPQL